MNFRRLLLSAVVAGGFIGSAVADDVPDPKGWYLGAGGGANWLHDQQYEDPGVFNVDVDYASGMLLGGFLGYKFDSDFRLEFELAYRENDVDFIQIPIIGGVNTTSDIATFSQLVNLVYDYPLTDKTNLSLGGGAGGAQVEGDIGNAVGVPLADISDYVFAYQGIAGLSYQLMPQTLAYIDYRYFATDDLVTNVGTTSNLDNENHSVMVGIRWFTDAQGPVVCTDCGPWTVLFGLDKSNIDATGSQIIDQAVNESGAANDTIYLDVVGHTDGLGSAAYNDALSLRRAQSVHDALVSRGVPSGNITVTGAGEGAAITKVGDNVPDPLSRRAVISVK
jgi:opacity protein-like surface antigen